MAMCMHGIYLSRCTGVYLLLLFLLCLHPGFAVAQSFAINPSWVGTSASDTREARLGLASALASMVVEALPDWDGIFPGLGKTGPTASTLYSLLALQDYLAAEDSWKTNVTAKLDTWLSTQHDIFAGDQAKSNRTTSNAAQWGLAFIYIYRAYANQTYLELAENAFDQIYPYFFSVEDATSQHVPGNRNLSHFTEVSPSNNCYAPSEGGIFWLPEAPNSDESHTDSVGSFAVLAGLLYEATQNETYKDAGMLSTKFLTSWNLDDSGIIDNVQHLLNCDSPTATSSGTQGWFIHALAVWANITGDSSLNTQLRQAVSGSTITNEPWVHTNGSLASTDQSSSVSAIPWDENAILVRGLSETLRRCTDSADSDLVQYVRAFLNIQYNTLIFNSRGVGGNYSPNVLGPPPPNFGAINYTGNVFALDILNAGFDAVPRLSNGTTASSAQATPTATGKSTESSNAASSSPTGEIVGVAIGGVSGTAMIFLVIIWWRRRSGNAGGERDMKAGDVQRSSVVDPYTLTAPSATYTKGAPPFTSGIREANTAEDAVAPPSTEEQAHAVEASGDTGGVRREDISTFVRRLVNNLWHEHQVPLRRCRFCAAGVPGMRLPAISLYFVPVCSTSGIY
ncbi:unnamed protein product [Peniophora sp. CBMAI 1063]|nr:unnamed protein product [Peniophora sp. CBMAI 1063]